MPKPCDGGCWYCHKKDDALSFCHEFDTYLHIECIKKALADANGAPDEELKIIANEFKELLK